MRKILLLLISSMFYISGAFAQQDTSKNAKDTLPKTDTIRYIPGAKAKITRDTITLSEDPGNSSGSGIKGSKPSTGTASRTSAGASDLGRTMGSLDVSQSGSATYTVPIAVPPGINGVVPQVSLSYNSQGGNGLAGYGWNVGGVSSISRIPATKFHDGRVGSINIDANDRYALDGQRLILKSGTYGADGAEYQTENYSNLKIISHGYSGYGSNYFEVDYPDGSIANYGYSTDSKTSTDWALSYTDNPQGVRINYSYLQDNNTIVISQISYGASGTATPFNQINFVYKDRQRNEQAWIAGINFFRTKILSEVNVVANGTAYRNYILTHDIVSTLYYERLTSITEQSGDQTKSFEPVNFGYFNTGAIIAHSGVSNLSVRGISQSNADAITSDFTGDGTMDFILYPKTKDKIWTFWDPNSTTPYTQYGPEIPTGTFEEIFPVSWLTYNNKILSGQGFVLVKYDSDYNVRFEVKSAGTTAPVYAQYDKLWNANYQYYSACTNGYKNGKIPMQFISGDFNGDGLTDVIAVSKPYSFITSESQSGYGCNPQYSDFNTSYVHFINLDRRLSSNFTQLAGYLTKSFSGSDKLYAADMNGDGKTDIIHISTGVMYVYGLDENNNLYLLWQPTNDSRITLNYPALLGDYNGDGKTDILFPTSSTAPQNRLFAAFLSTGKGFQKYEQSFSFSYSTDTYSNGNLTTRHIIPSDINGDGKTDIVSFVANTRNGSNQGSVTLNVYHNTGSTSAQSSPIFTGGGFISQPTTLIHYPIPVFLTSEKPNYGLELAAMSDNSLSWFKFQKDIKTDAQLNSVEQDGVIHFIDYKNLKYDQFSSDLQIYESNLNQTFPNVDIQLAPGLNVVSAVRRFYNGSQIKQIFGYRGAVSNTEGLGFLGFSEVIKSNWHENYSDQNRLFTINMFSPELRGAPLKSFTAKNTYLSTAIKETPALSPDISLSDPSTTAQTVVASNSVTLLPGFSANSNDGTFVAQIDPALGNNDSGTLNDYITRTSYIYKTELLPNKVFVNVPTSVSVKDLLNGTTSQQTFSYDTYYNVSKESGNYSGAGTKTTEVTYDNSIGSSYYIGRPLVKKTTLTGSGDAYTSEEQYTYSGYLPTQIKRKGHNTSFITENLQYDGYGNVTNKTIVTNSGQRSTQMQYDGTGRFMTKATDAEGMETHWQYDPSTGNVLTKTDPYNLTSSYAYDEWGRLAQTTDYLNVKSYRTLQKSGSDLIITESDDEGSEKTTTVNALGKTMEVKSKDVLGQIVGKAYQYDIYDRPTGESEPSIGGSYNQWNTTAYDEYGRVRQTTAFTGKTTNITYNGLSVTGNDGTKSVTTTKDALGNVISTQDPGGTINNTYFANGNLKSAGLAGSTQSIEQDGWGRKTKLTDPSAGVYTYAYNDFGETTAETTPKGSTAYTYDTNGKLQSKRVQGDNTDMDYQYTYDGTSKLLTSLNLTNTDGNNAVYTYTYDGYKRPIGTVEDNVNARFSKTLTYDSYGRANTESSEARNKLNGKTASKTIVSSYQYGQLKSISDNSTGQRIWEVDALNARGQVTAALLGTTLKESSSFDQYGLPQEIKTDRLGANAAELMKLGYSFDAQRGNLSSRSNTAFGWNESFNYDNLDRLTNFNDNNSNQSQTYDGQGRIATNSSLGNYAYSGNSYRQSGLNNVTSAAYSWYQKRPLQQISYNAFKSPVEIAEQGKEKVSFQYNAAEGRSAMYYGDENADKLQRRYRKFYSEDGSMEVTNDVQAGSTSFVFYLGGDAYSAPAIWKEVHTPSTIAQNLYYLHRDHLGSIVMITDVNGNIAEKRQFDAWGNVVKLTDGSGNPLTAFMILDRGYTGHEHLFGVALINMNARLYDPVLHRFLSPDNFVQDPFNTQSYNRYGYVMNNPLVRVDKDGNFFFVPIIIGAAILGGGGNVFSHWGEIVKHPWSAIGYFASGAVGGAVAATPLGPWLGGSITALGNVATDVAYGNLPKFNGIGSVAKYIGGVALDGVGAAGAASLSKLGFNVASQFGWVENVTLTGTSQIVSSGINTFSALAPEVSVTATKVPIASLLETVAGQAGKIAAKDGVQYTDDLVKAAQQLYPKKAALTELHHITPKYLGGAANGPLIPLNGSYHQVITNAFRTEWGYGLGKPSAAQLETIMNKVYRQFPLPK